MEPLRHEQKKRLAKAFSENYSASELAAPIHGVPDPGFELLLTLPKLSLSAAFWEATSG